MRSLLPLLAAVLLGAAPPPERATGGMVAADHRLASAAGAAVLAQGGNAVDAAVAAALAAGVVQPAGSGLGGGGFAVVVEPSGSPHVLDFREVAPAAATADMYANAADPDASRLGGLAVAVPGEPLGLAELHRRWGVLPLSQVTGPSIALARDGFEMEAHLANALAKTGVAGPRLARGLFDEAEVPQQGQRVRRRKLAATLERFAATEGRGLVTGEVAADIAGAVQATGGILTTDDLAAYTPKTRDAVVGRYRGWTVVTMPPPSSGGIVLMAVLGALESSDLPALGSNSAAYIHRLTEAMKHAYADRANFMGDPDRVHVPVDRLLSPQRIREVQVDFDPERTREPAHYGLPMDVGQDAGTQHISVIDADGMAVALTSTINTSFASRVVAPQSGILLNNEMDDFVARPGEPNAYGLVGSEANAVAAGSRPLSSMSPTVLIAPGGRERIVIGASGGPFIISSTVQVIANIIDFGMDPAEAVSVPRVHHQWMPNRLFVDTHTSPDTIAALEKRGHAVQVLDFFSSVQAIHVRDGEVLGASDPRKGGWPVGTAHPREGGP
ncbi:MAG: gamma-glutamyltransferase [Myxococcota bacterium]|nr:gamma-glutamyltransferase [Myxococcota bacterium]